MSNGALIELDEPLQSTDTTELHKALAEFNSMMTSVVASSTGEVRKEGKLLYTYNYAKLHHILEDIREPMSKCKLSITQDVFSSASGNPAVVTTLMHESGQWRRTRPLVIPTGPGAKAQDYGAAISYARRYQLNAMLNLAVEDPDGPTDKPARARKEGAPEGSATEALKSRARENVPEVTAETAVTRMGELTDAAELTRYMNALPTAMQKAVRKDFKARLDALKAH